MNSKSLVGFQVEDALDKAYPGAVLPNKGLVCSTTPSGTPALSEVMPWMVVGETPLYVFQSVSAVIVVTQEEQLGISTPSTTCCTTYGHNICVVSSFVTLVGPMDHVSKQYNRMVKTVTFESCHGPQKKQNVLSVMFVMIPRGKH